MSYPYLGDVGLGIFKEKSRRIYPLAGTKLYETSKLSID